MPLRNISQQNIYFHIITYSYSNETNNRCIAVWSLIKYKMSVNLYEHELYENVSRNVPSAKKSEIGLTCLLIISQV